MNASEYARHRNISKMRVSQYIQAGKITAVKVGKGYEIDPAVADEQLAGAIDARQPATKAVSKPPPPKNDPVDAEKSLVVESPPPASKGGPTYAEAQRAREVYRAERERLKLLQEKAELVAAADVKKEMFSLCRSVRDNMIGIPDRVASQLAATTDHYEVHRLLLEEIRTALRVLADG